MAVEYIEAGGAQRPFLAGYRAQARFQIWREEFMGEDHSKSDLVELGIEGTVQMAFVGFYYGAIKENQPTDFTIETVEGWLDDDIGVVIKVSEAWNRAQPHMIAEVDPKSQPLVSRGQRRASQQSLKKTKP
jgi:hypothetical protein